jgi:hypothetical protein
MFAGPVTLPRSSGGVPRSSAAIRGRPDILRAYLSDAPPRRMYTKSCARFGVHSRTAHEPVEDRTLPTNLSGVFAADQVLTPGRSAADWGSPQILRSFAADARRRNVHIIVCAVLCTFPAALGRHRRRSPGPCPPGASARTLPTNLPGVFVCRVAPDRDPQAERPNTPGKFAESVCLPGSVSLARPSPGTFLRGAAAHLTFGGTERRSPQGSCDWRRGCAESASACRTSVG